MLQSVLVGLLAVASILQTPQRAPLIWKPKAGEITIYKLEGKMTTLTTAAMSIAGTQRDEIVKMAGDAITRTTTMSTVGEFEGTDVPIPETTDAIKMKSSGLVVEVVSDGKPSVDSLRNYRLTSFVFPVKPIGIGDTWTSTGDWESLDLPGFKVDFRVAGEEKVSGHDAWKIATKGAETSGAAPNKVEATYWIDKSSGMMIRRLLRLNFATRGTESYDLVTDVTLQTKE